jgi:hypothetical protein
MDIPKDLQEKLEWMQRNQEIQEKSRLRESKKREIQEDSKQKSIRDTMNYMGGGKYNKKNHKNY